MFRLILVATAAFALVLPGRALAVPGNDAFASATSLDSLPFAETLDLGGASTEPGEPQSCNFQTQSVLNTTPKSLPDRLIRTGVETEGASRYLPTTT